MVFMPVLLLPHTQSPEIRKYKRKFNGEILCGALWGVNLLVGTDNGLLLLDRSGHGKGGLYLEKLWCLNFQIVPSSSHSLQVLFLPYVVFPLISRRKFSQIEVIESHNVLVCINGRKNKLRVYYLSWLRNKILRGGDDVSTPLSLPLSLPFFLITFLSFLSGSMTVTEPAMATYQLETLSTVFTTEWCSMERWSFSALALRWALRSTHGPPSLTPSLWPSRCTHTHTYVHPSFKFALNYRSAMNHESIATD